MFKSKKERAFYVQAGMVTAYVIARCLHPQLATFDPTLVILMGLLASYHLAQAAVDFKK